MARKKLQRTPAALWDLVERQHGVVSRSQLLAAGLTRDAIEHRLATGRLHRMWRGVYAVGRRSVGQRGRWMAAVLSSGPHALLSHRSAAALWGLTRDSGQLEVVVPGDVWRRRRGILVHRRTGLSDDERRTVHGIPVTDPTATLVDLAACLRERPLERAINEADRLDLVDPESLRSAIDRAPRRPGLGRLRRLLAGKPLTDSGLERRFLSLVEQAGLPLPETQALLNGYRVDFYWPQLGLVVEADGWRHHRTPGEQATDRRRDQAHAVAGLTAVRFAEAQIRYEPARVKATLKAVMRRLTRAR